jgi:hypothetical protein
MQLQIGVADLEAFAEILPDEAFEERTGNSDPLETRLQRFFISGLGPRPSAGQRILSADHSRAH